MNSTYSKQCKKKNAELGQQSATEHTPPPGIGIVQRVVGVVQYGLQFVQSPSFCHCHQRVQLCAHN